MALLRAPLRGVAQRQAAEADQQAATEGGTLQQAMRRMHTRQQEILNLANKPDARAAIEKKMTENMTRLLAEEEPLEKHLEAHKKAVLMQLRSRESTAILLAARAVHVQLGSLATEQGARLLHRLGRVYLEDGDAASAVEELEAARPRVWRWLA